MKSEGIRELNMEIFSQNMVFFFVSIYTMKISEGCRG